MPLIVAVSVSITLIYPLAYAVETLTGSVSRDFNSAGILYVSSAAEVIGVSKYVSGDSNIAEQNIAEQMDLSGFVSSIVDLTNDGEPVGTTKVSVLPPKGIRQNFRKNNQQDVGLPRFELFTKAFNTRFNI